MNTVQCPSSLLTHWHVTSLKGSGTHPCRHLLLGIISLFSDELLSLLNCEWIFFLFFKKETFQKGAFTKLLNILNLLIPL